MTPHAHQFEDTDKQSVVFRGYVKVYHGQRVEEVNCEQVRRNKLRAYEDAEKLIKKLKKNEK